MAGLFTPTSRSSGGVPNLKLTSNNNNNSPITYSNRSGNRSPGKRHSLLPSNGNSSSAFADCTLSLKRVIGCSTTAFDSHAPSRSFAYTAGAAAVVASLDDDLEVSQRFFRARPNAPTLTVAAGAPYSPGTPQQSAQESRNRAAASLREAGIGYSPSYGGGEDSGSGGKTWTARERIKAATCLSFSPDGKWLAVGETGYNPRVLIFSMSKDVPSDVPVAAMSEHTFGVRDVAFSPDSKYLASIGTANDGFIYIWSLNPDRADKRTSPVQLHASNKCTSFIRQIAWMGKCLVTVGTRHVKLWKTNDDTASISGPQVLHGRNALLGNMSDSTMSCVVGISEDKALVCSERGDICLLEETGMKFSKVADAGFRVNCIAVDPERKFAWVAGSNGSHSALVLKDIVPPTPPASPSSSRSSSPISPAGCRQANVLAMASMLGHLFTLDSNHSLKIINMSTVNGVPTPSTVIRELPAHKNACLGVRTLPVPLESGATFFTWSADGVVLFWTLDGLCKEEFEVELEQPSEGEDDMPNELKVVRVSKYGDYFVTGDKYGVLRVIDAKSRECRYAVKAHGAEIMDIAIHYDTIVSCARDRMAQVFVRDQPTGSWSLSQTLDDHTASVSRVLFLEDGNKLLSCSTDRTIVVRELCRRESASGTVTWAYIPIRTLSTKASPIHMTALSDTSTTLLVSTLDRQIVKFDMVTGKSLHSFKVTDESGDAVVMDAITLTEDRGTSSKPRIVVGTSTTDKSIRLYDLNGGLVDKEWGHTEGVSDVALFEDKSSGDINLISTGTDGTIMIWDFINRGKESSFDSSSRDGKDGSDLDSPTLTPKDTPTASRTPLRRVLSRSELVDFSSTSTPAPTTPAPTTPVLPATPDPSRVAVSQSVGSMSPPRPLRKKGSTYSLHRQTLNAPKGRESNGPNTPTQPPPLDVTTLGPALTLSKSKTRESRTRGRTPSPPDADKRALSSTSRRSSRVRGKSDAGLPVGVSSTNTLAESLTRSLRTFRRKMDGSSENSGVKPEVLRDLQRELSLTIKDLGVDKDDNRSRKKEGREGRQERSSSSSNEGDMMAALLEQYSSKLLSMVNDRLDGKYSKTDDGIDPIDSTESFQDRERTIDRRQTSGEG